MNFKLYCTCGDEMHIGEYDPDVPGLEFHCLGCNVKVFIDIDKKNEIANELKDLIDILYLHRGDEVGSYTMINTGEMEQAIERAVIVLKKEGRIL